MFLLAPLSKLLFIDEYIKSTMKIDEYIKSTMKI